MESQPLIFRIMDKGQIILYQTQEGESKIEVRLANESVWLTADQMAELFQRDRSTIQRHIKRIYMDGELKEDLTCAFFAQVQFEGSRKIKRNIPTYNLDMIISVGYRVNSYRGVQFRQWATQVLKEYMIKGFALNDELLTNAGSISAEMAKGYVSQLSHFGALKMLRNETVSKDWLQPNGVTSFRRRFGASLPRGSGRPTAASARTSLSLCRDATPQGR